MTIAEFDEIYRKCSSNNHKEGAKFHDDISSFFLRYMHINIHKLQHCRNVAARLVLQSFAPSA